MTYCPVCKEGTGRPPTLFEAIRGSQYCPLHKGYFTLNMRDVRAAAEGLEERVKRLEDQRFDGYNAMFGG